MRIVIAGASGLVGKALVPFLQAAGDEVVKLKHDVDYSIDTMTMDPERLKGSDVIINLAGESIAKRWSESNKQKIKASRVKTTKLISETAARLSNPPKLIINASAIGFYGDKGDQLLSESSPSGSGFLAEVVRDWEAALDPARKAKIRVVPVRFGMILSPKGGALAQMLWPFKLGLGGRIGSGKQYMSWIALEDVIGAIYHVMNTEKINAPVNVVSPNPVRNMTFTKILGKVLHRPTLFPVPEFAVKFLLGEMGEELLLSSDNVMPKKLQESGYPFLYPQLEDALINQLKEKHGLS